jgi:hypothetical protein
MLVPSYPRSVKTATATSSSDSVSYRRRAGRHAARGRAADASGADAGQVPARLDHPEPPRHEVAVGQRGVRRRVRAGRVEVGEGGGLVDVDALGQVLREGDADVERGLADSFDHGRVVL